MIDPVILAQDLIRRRSVTPAAAGAMAVLHAALEQAGWVQAKAARLLDMTPRQIAYRIQTLNIKVRQI